MVAQEVLLSTKPFAGYLGDQANEAPLSGLHDGALELGARHVEARHGAPVDLHPALCDQAPRLARRQLERLCENGREMQRIAVREPMLGDVIRRAPFAHDAREVLLGGARCLLAVRPRDDPARERELGFERLAVG